MPGRWIALAAAVRDRWPAIKLVVVSGHVTGERALAAGTHFFGKPYMAEEIAASLYVFFH
jgi:hypothetical protein